MSNSTRRHLKISKLLRDMTLSAMMAALSIILTRFFSFNAAWFRLGLGNLPIILSSVFLGPIWGGLVGFCSDLIGALVFPYGPYFYGYTINATVQGILPWCVLTLFHKRKNARFLVYVILACIITLYSTLFVATHDVFKKNPLPIWSRVLIPIGFACYFLIIFVIYYFLNKKKTWIFKGKKFQEKFSLGEFYLIFMVNVIIISFNLLGLWNFLVVKLDYLVNAFTQAIIFMVESILKSVLCYLLINAFYSIKEKTSFNQEESFRMVESKQELTQDKQADDHVNDQENKD